METKYLVVLANNCRGVVVFILSCSLLLDVHALQVQELLKERVILEAPKVITDNKQTNDQTNESVQEPSRIPNKNLTCQFVFQRLSSVLGNYSYGAHYLSKLNSIRDKDRLKEFAYLIGVHLSKAPVHAVGTWMYRPDERPKFSNPHLQCLREEHQGNCANQSKTTKYNIRRLSRVTQGALRNSPGMFDSHDPYVWEGTGKLHQVLSSLHYNGNQFRNILSQQRIFLLGDSLTRQWGHAMRCEMIHIFNHTKEQAHDRIRTLEWNNGKTKVFRASLSKFLKLMRSRDYLVFNFGHHMDPGKRRMKYTWTTKYQQTIKTALRELKTSNSSRLHPSRILFRTTTVRHFRAGQGDWNTNASNIGGTEPENNARYEEFGGNNQAQPLQNLMALNIIGTESNFGILDTSSLTLARADATFDGSHMCLPGPMEYWSRMLYYRIFQDSTRRGGDPASKGVLSNGLLEILSGRCPRVENHVT